MDVANQDQSTQVSTPIAPTSPLPATHDPGKTLGIVGFILAFTGTQLIGLILSILGYRKSAKAGFKNTLALVGIILNSIFLVLISIGILLLIFFIAIPSVQRLQEAMSKCEELGVGTHQNVSLKGSSGTLVCKSDESFKFSSRSYNLEFSK